MIIVLEKVTTVYEAPALTIDGMGVLSPAIPSGLCPVSATPAVSPVSLPVFQIIHDFLVLALVTRRDLGRVQIRARCRLPDVGVVLSVRSRRWSYWRRVAGVRGVVRLIGITSVTGDGGVAGLGFDSGGGRTGKVVVVDAVTVLVLATVLLECCPVCVEWAVFRSFTWVKILSVTWF